MSKDIKHRYLLELKERYGTLPRLALHCRIPLRTLENWKYEITEMPDYIFRYLKMLEDKTTLDKQLIDRIYRLQDWIYTDNSICKEDKEYIDYELTYILTILKGAHKIIE